MAEQIVAGGTLAVVNHIRDVLAHLAEALLCNRCPFAIHPAPFGKEQIDIQRPLAKESDIGARRTQHFQHNDGGKRIGECCNQVEIGG